MKIVSADITGSLIVNGVDVTTNVVSSSIFSGSIAGRVTSLEQFSSSLDATFATDASVTASILVLSQSVQNSQAALSSSYTATSGSYVITSGSYAASSASLSTRVTTNETNITTLTNASASFAVVSSSFSSTSGSLSTRVTNLEATSSTVSSSFASTSGSIAGRVTLIEGQYATTGSNNFTGPQFINQASNAISFTSTASLYTDGGLRVAKDSYVSGTAYFNNITVYGTSSIEYITSSQIDIGSNVITVNTDTPAIRFGGISVFDSGSTQLTGSLFWDSEKNHWIYSNPSGSSYNSAMLMNGPRNTGSLGTEQGTTNNALMKGQGGDHITSSQMIDDGTTVQIPGNLQVTGSISGSSALYSSTVTATNGLLIGNGGVTATTNYLSKFTGASTIGNSQIFDNGTNVGINQPSPTRTLDILGASGIGTVLKLQGASGTTTYLQMAYNGATNAQSGYIGYNSSSQMQFFTNDTVALTIDSNRNLGLGVTPSAWSLGKALDISGGPSILGLSNSTQISNNAYYNSAWIYKATSFAQNFVLDNDGGFKFFQAPSGTAGNAITFTQAMTLFSTGNLAVGTTTDSGYKLDVNGTGRFTGNVLMGTSSLSNPVGFGNVLNIKASDAALVISNTGGTAKNWSIGALQSGSLSIFDGTTLRMDISSTGNVSITDTASFGGQARLFSRITADATTVGKITDSSFHIWNTTNVGSLSQITFGYTNGSTTNASVYLGLITTNGTGSGFGDFVLGTAPSANVQCVERFRIASTGAATFSSSVTTGGSAYIQPNASSNNVGLFIQNNSTGGYGSSLGLGLYGYNTSAYFNPLRIESSYAGYGIVNFYVKTQSTSTEIAALNILCETGAASFYSTVSTGDMVTIAISDISTGENKGLRLNNTGASGKAWNITAGQAGSNNADFVIRNSTSHVNNLILDGSSGAATFSSSIGATSAGISSTSISTTASTTLSSSRGIIVDASTTTNSAFVPIGFSWAASVSTYNPTWGMGLQTANYNAGTANLVFYTAGTTRMTILDGGSVSITGALSKGSGSFRIKHPLVSKKNTHQLVHSFIEGPQADLIYRGKIRLVAGRATVNIDEAATMTEGTFEALCREVQCFTSNETSWDSVRGKVEGNILTIECQNTNSTDEISWIVIGERQDEHMYETDWTDENGKVVVEPLIPTESEQ